MSLGWDIYISRPSQRLAGPDDPRIDSVEWKDRVLIDERSLYWLPNREESMDAVLIGNGYGYPDQYLVRAHLVRPILSSTGCTDVGESASLDVLKACGPDEWLLAICWDRS